MNDEKRASDIPEQPALPSHPLLIPGLLVVFVIIVLEALMLWQTNGHLTRAYQIVLYTGVAIVTGVLFWLLTPGSMGEVDLKQLGIRLGGGAAIGAAFMLLAWFLTDPETNHVVAPVPFGIPQEFTIHNQSPNDLADVGEVRTISGRRYLYAEFRSGHDEGILNLKHLRAGSAGFSTPSYQITLEGELIVIADTPEEQSR